MTRLENYLKVTFSISPERSISVAKAITALVTAEKGGVSEGKSESKAGNNETKKENVELVEAFSKQWASCKQESIDGLSDYEISFAEQFLERFSKYGAKTFVSEKQAEVLDKILEKLI